MTWRMWAYRRESAGGLGPTYWHAGPRRYVELHGLSDPVVEVELEEDPVRGEYYGWLAAGATAPTMVWPRWALYSMCFAYGPEAEEARGRGRTVRMTAAEVTRC